MPRKSPPPLTPVSEPPAVRARLAIGRLLATVDEHLTSVLAGGPPPEPELWSRLYGEKESLAGMAIKLAQCLMRLEEAETAAAASPVAPEAPASAPDLDLLERYVARHRKG